MAENLTTEPVVDTQGDITQKLLQENFVLGNWVIGVLEGCEGCTEGAIKWVEGQQALLAAHQQLNHSPSESNGAGS